MKNKHPIATIPEAVAAEISLTVINGFDVNRADADHINSRVGFAAVHPVVACIAAVVLGDAGAGHRPVPTALAGAGGAGGVVAAAGAPGDGL